MDDARLGPCAAAHRREIAILLACARVPSASCDAAMLAGLLAETVDWTWLIRTALDHGVSPLIAARLAEVQGVPADIRAALGEHLDDNRGRAAALTGALLELLDVSGATGIELLPFAGPVLGALAFGDTALRRAHDLDVFVRGGERDRLSAVMADADFHELVPARGIARRARAAGHRVGVRDRGPYAFFRRRDRVRVEVHSAIAPPWDAAPLGEDRLWARMRRWPLLGREIAGFALEDVVLLLCARGRTRGWTTLDAVADLAALLAAHPGVDIAGVVDEARMHGNASVVLIGLGLARRLFASDVPDTVLAALRADVSARTLVDRFARRLMGEGLAAGATRTTSAGARRSTAAGQCSRRRRPRRRALGVLVIDWLPRVQEGAGAPRMNAIVRLLAARGHRVTLYPVVPSLAAADEIFTGPPPNLEIVRGRGLEAVEEFLAERAAEFDAIVVSRPPVMRAMLEVFDRRPEVRSGARLVYDAEAVFALREIARRRLIGEAVDEVTAGRMIAEEAALGARADVVIAVSAAEQAMLERCLGRPVVLLPHAVRATPTPGDFAERRGLLFVGRLAEEGWPNTDALVWFREHVFARILARLAAAGDAATLTVAGMLGAPSVATPHPRIRMLGVVSDLAPLYGGARVFVAPTRFSAGVPLKIYEAAAHGVPVVGTDLLAEQLGWCPGEDLLASVVTDPDAFAENVVALYTDSELWRRVRAAALARVERECDWDRIGAMLEDVLSASRSSR